jgi:4-amino-4-deoxy-L-arabinose transferase-like glycosyltransferase
MKALPAGAETESSDLSRTPVHRARGLVLLLAFLVARMSLVALPAMNPQGGILVDSQRYLSLAAGIAVQGRYTDPTGQDFIWPAGYPLFITLASGWSAPNPVAVAFAQLAMTGMIAVLVVALGDRLGNRGVALAGGWLYALLPTAALWALTVMSETLFTVILLLACLSWLASIQRARPLLGAAAGLALGLAAFVRPIGLALVPLWVLLTVIALRRDAGWRRALAVGAATIIGATMIVLPWSLRNLATHGVFAFSGVGERTFFNFNVAQVKAEAEGITRDQAASELGTSSSNLVDSLRIITRYPGAFALEQAKGLFRTLFGLEAGSWARLLGYPEDLRSGLGIVSSLLEGDPGLAISRLVRVLANPKTGPIILLAAGSEALTVIVYGLAVVFIIWGRPKGSRAALLLASSAILLAVLPAAAGQARFRTPIEPMLVVLAAWGGGFLLRRTRRASAAL